MANDPVWVAFVDGLVAGGIFLKPLPDAMKLANIAVHPNFSGRGIGRMLITKAEKESSAMGYCQMKLNTHIKMVENITMYAHLGWQEISRTGNTVTMSKDLNAD
ncbi:MAG: GNAT family N-acetyltransferase [Pseudomonadota bacterium]